MDRERNGTRSRCRRRPERAGARRATAQRALEAGVLDELQDPSIPVLFGSGRRLFESPGPDVIGRGVRGVERRPVTR